MTKKTGGRKSRSVPLTSALSLSYCTAKVLLGCCTEQLTTSAILASSLLAISVFNEIKKTFKKRSITFSLFNGNMLKVRFVFYFFTVSNEPPTGSSFSKSLGFRKQKPV